MKKLAKKFQNLLKKLSDRTTDMAVEVMTDVSGSDTTEKIGMVVVAVVIVGLLAVAVKAFMPNLFNSIGSTAQEKLNGIFN